MIFTSYGFRRSACAGDLLPYSLRSSGSRETLTAMQDAAYSMSGIVNLDYFLKEGNCT